MGRSDLNTLVVPGYKVLSKLGQGAMAQVYLAVQEALDRKVALKVMAETLLVDPEFSERFLREAKIIAQLSHPNIVSVYDVGIHQGCHYLSMEYHAGGDLKAKITQGITLNEAQRIVRQIAEALDYAHSEGYVHRDVKPENILFDRNGNAILTDFGIARSGDATSKMTAVGTIMGTPKYMSPEQAKGDEVDSRTDLYSLGVIFYEMLTGSAPYSADHPLAICQMHVANPIPDLPKALAMFQPLIHACMAKQPKQRIGSGKDIIAMLEKVSLDQPMQGGFAIDGMTMVPIPKEMVDSVDFSQVQQRTEVLKSDQPVSTFAQTDAAEANASDLTRNLGKENWPSQARTKKPSVIGRLLVFVAMFALVGVLGVKMFLAKEKPGVFAMNNGSSEPGLSAVGEPNENAARVTLLSDADPLGNGQQPQLALDLLRSVSIVAPQTKSLCQSPDPYLLGQRFIGENDSLHSGECFSIRIETGQKTDLIVYSHSQDGTLYRLLPNRCNAMGLNGKQFTEGEPVQFPLDSKHRLTVIGLDQNPGREWVYAIGVSGEKAKQSVLKRLSAAQDVCEVRVEGGKLGKIEVKTAQDELNRLSNEFRGELQWMSRSFTHKVL